MPEALAWMVLESLKLGGVAVSFTGMVVLEASVEREPAGAETMLQEIPVTLVVKPAQRLSASVATAAMPSGELALSGGGTDTRAPITGGGVPAARGGGGGE